MFARILVLALVSFSSLLAFSQSQAVTLGVLEDLDGHYYGDPNFRAVRVVFQKEGDAWKSFHHDCRDQSCLKTVSAEYPREVTWTIGFDGRKLGPVTGRTQKAFHYYAEVGIQDIISGDPIPTVGKREASGFSEFVGYRPLVATSQTFVSDPDVWRPFNPNQDLVGVLRKQFRQKFPRLCRESKPDSGKLEPFPYQDQDIGLIKAYKSKAGWVVAHLRMEAIDCNDVEAGFNIEDPWFVVNPGQSAAYLESGLWLVDAGDYDNDGKSELVFSINRDDEGGYELFYRDFNKRTVFNFNYH